MAEKRNSWVLWLSLAGLLGIALIWSIGWYAAPVRHPELARAVLMASGRENQLSGASFDCRRDPDLAARICVTSLSGRSLVLQLAAMTCKASLAGVPLPCRLDFGLVTGVRSVRVEAPAWTVGTFAMTATPHLDLLGTRSECEWGRIAQVTGILLPVLVVIALAQRHPSSATRRQWAWRIFGVLASISPLWIGMVYALYRWHYID